MVKKLVILILAIAFAAILFVGCSENYKTGAIATDMSDLTVSSNGGLAVRVGKYLYYINGYAGNTVDNNFGDVKKGAIARVELDENGIPIDSTNQIIVPKNVYNTAATSGLYVSGEYIYYSSPSVEKGKSGEPKVGEMYLMRTKLDGTDTSVVAKFKDYTPVYKVVDGYILYVSENNLHEIDLNSKKFDDKIIAEEIQSYHLPEYKNGSNAFVNSVFYIKASEDKNETQSVLWYYKAGGTAKVAVDALHDYDANKLEHPKGYTLTFVESLYVGNNLRLVYTKTDSGTNAISKGTYSYDFDSSVTFNSANEVRYTWENNVTGLRFLNDTNLLAVSGNNLVLMTKGADRWESKDILRPSSAPSLVDVKITEENVTVYCLISSIVYKVQILDIDQGAYNVAVKASVEIFKSSVSSAWLPLDKIGSVIYFFNSNVSDYTYYYNLDNAVARDAESLYPTLLSLITVADEITLMG